MGKKLRVTMVIFVIILLMSIIILVNVNRIKGLYKQIFKPEALVTESEIDMKKVRYPNLNRTTVKVGNSLVKLLKHDIQVDGVDLGLKRDFKYEPNSLAVVGKFAYCQDDLGLLRVNLEDPNIVHTLYYDVYDFVAVGKDSLYIFRDSEPYKISKEGKESSFNIPGPSGRIYEIYDDMLIYENISNKLVFLNLTGNDIPEELEYNGNLMTYNLTEDGIFIVKTDLESKEINLNEMSIKLRPEQSRMENPDFTLEPKEIIKDEVKSIANPMQIESGEQDVEDQE